MDRELLEYFRDETNRRFEELRQDIKDLTTKVDEKVNDLQQFKVSMIVSSRWISLIVSAVCGLITLLVTVGLTIWSTTRAQHQDSQQPSKGGQENVGFIDSVGSRISDQSRNQ
jgi:hypothetical protein